MNAMPGTGTLRRERQAAAHDLGYSAQIDGRTAIVWSEEFGAAIRAQWVLSIEAESEIGAYNSLELTDGHG